MVVDVLTHNALLFSVYDLKGAQMNLQCSQIWELIFYQLGHNATEATKNIYCANCECTVDHSKQRLMKFCFGYKNLNDQA